MNFHMADPQQLNSMYSFWNKLFFGEDKKKKSATETPKTEKAPEPAKPLPAKPATSSYEKDFAPMSMAGYGSPGAAQYHGTASAALAKHSMSFAPVTFFTTFLSGFMKYLKAEKSPREDSFAKIDCYGDRVY